MLYQHPIRSCLMLAFLLLCSWLPAEAQQYEILYHSKDKDSTAGKMIKLLQKSFPGKEKADEYLKSLPALFLQKGYPGVSIDSVASHPASADVYLFIGDKFFWILNLDSVPGNVLSALHLKRNPSVVTGLEYPEVRKLEEGMLNFYENTGYPFAKINSETNRIDSNKIFTTLKIQTGSSYPIDSIRVFGKVKISNRFLQHYLGISDGDLYNKNQLSQINKRLADLPYLKQQSPWDLMMLGSGATINLYLEPRRSSEVNALIGFLPGNSITGKTKITADVRLNLRNALAGGETILLNWQQIQAQSPRLDLGYNQPYLFNTPYGIDFSFGMLKQDSAWLSINGRLGVQYFWSANQSFSVFYQIKNSYLLQGGIDTLRVIQTHQLPSSIDVRSGTAGVSFALDNTNYKLNPRRGTTTNITVGAGIKNVRPSDDILNLKDPANPTFDFKSLYDTIKQKSYVFSFVGSGAHYFPVAKAGVVKLAGSAGWLQSPQVYLNELFRIGGYRLLRGFDEESIYADRYGVTTAEYRYLTGVNSFLFGFLDLGFTHSKLNNATFSNSYQSVGIGIELETKAGMLNLSYAIGKRNDIKFDLRSASKIHFGYINYF